MKAAMSIEPQRFRDLMAAVAAPVTVVATMGGGRPYGATVSSFASLSLEPQLITVAFDNRSSMLARVLSARTFGVNLLGCAQADLAVLFA
jgi:flavin reductase (DIM6/NTAB) family NADH-FMN oxidoreductase RutF